MVEAEVGDRVSSAFSPIAYSAKAATVGKSDSSNYPAATPLQKPQKCPECQSVRLYKAGLRYLNGGPVVQRWLCRTCGLRFVPKDKSEHVERVSTKTLKRTPDIPSQGRVCVSENESKNLENQARQELAQREGTLSQRKIVDFIWYMKKNGRAESTILGRVKLIKRLAKLGADLYDPESVKGVIASQSWTAGRKDLACDAYATFLATTGGTWKRPTYKIVDKEPFIPQPSEVKQLIAGCSPRMACFLQVLSETAMRPGELWQLTWKDYDQPTRTIKVTPEKGSKSGTYKVSKELAAMVEALPHKYGDTIFSKPGMPLDHHSRNFTKQRKRITNKLKNPRLLNISFKTLRHFRGTMEAWRKTTLSSFKNFSDIETSRILCATFTLPKYYSAIKKNT